MKKLLLVLLLSISASASAGDVTYVGGGRHSCSGSDCERFNAIKNSGRYENVNPSGSTPSNNSTRDFIEDYDRKQEMEKYRNQLRSESEARERARVEKERAGRPVTKAEAQANIDRLEAQLKAMLEASEAAANKR